MEASYLNETIMATVGTATPGRLGLVTAKDIQKFCAATDEHNPLYLDIEAARKAGFSDVVAPPLFNAVTTRPAPHRSGLVGDGQYDDTAPPGLSHLQTMLAGQAWDLIRPTVAGERLVEVFVTKSITERQGKTGNIVFVEKESTLSTLEGEVVERYVNTLILRKAPPSAPPFAPEPTQSQLELPTTEFSGNTLTKRPDMISLFMFSAAIWAVHRIHWDTPYAQFEGLPLPVVPGWMLSSYLAQLAEMKAPAQQRLKRIGVRYKGMVHPGDTLTCTAAPKDDGGILLSMTNQRGHEVAQGEAAYADR